jgi:WD40 repeat protein
MNKEFVQASEGVLVMPRPERPVDPAEGPVSRFAVDLRELRRCVGGPGYRELARRAHYSATALAQAARGTGLPSLAVTLAYVRACGGDVKEWEQRWRALDAELNPQLLPVPGDQSVGEGSAPYVGLAAYGPEHAEWFHGREDLVAALTERVVRQRFVAVVGASGAGKSSVLRAGLLPNVPKIGGGGWSTLVLTPGAHPLRECAVRLGARLGLSPGELSGAFAGRPDDLGLVIRQIQTGEKDGAEFVLVVDQFEEVFTLCQDAHEREQFITALLAAADCPDSRCRVVLGVRADFYAHCARHVGLAAAMQDAQVLVAPMSTDDLVRAVTQPAVRAGLMVEKTLVTAAVRAASERPGALPFLSHAMWETWRRRRGSGLFLAGYEAAGGLEGAVAQSADRVYAELDEQQRRAMRTVLLRLTALGEGTEDTRRRIGRAELGADPVVAEVVGRLAAARLLTLAEDTVEIAHEALIRGWPTLREWLTEDREALHAHRRLGEAATEWERTGRDEAYLYRGNALTAWLATELDAVNETEQAFLTASVARQDRDRAARRRRARASFVGMGVITVVVSVLAALALFQANRVADERDLALARQLAASARSQLEVDPELAMLLAIESVKVAPTDEGDAVLRQAVVDHRVLATLPTGQGRLNGVAISPNGRRIVTTGQNGTVQIWAQRNGSWQVRQALPLRGHSLPSPAFSPDSRYLAVAYYDLDNTSNGVVQVWDLVQGGDPVVFDSCGDFDDLSFRAVVFSPDGRRLAAASFGSCLWDLTDAHKSTHLDMVSDSDGNGSPGQAEDIEFTRDGRYLASASNGLVYVWDLFGQHERVVLADPPTFGPRVAFSADGQRLFSGDTIDGSLRVWNPRSGDKPTTLGNHGAGVSELAVSPDDAWLASSGDDGVIRLTDLKGQTDPELLRGHHGPVSGLAFRPDGKYLASVGDDGTLRLWSTAPVDATIVPGHEGPSWTAAFTPDGASVITGGRDGTVRRMRVGDDRSVVVCRRTDPGSFYEDANPIINIAVSPNGRAIASTAYADGVRVCDLHTGAVLRNLSGSFTWVTFVRDEQHILTIGKDVRLWGPSGEDEVITDRDYADLPVDVSRDRAWIAIGTRDGDVHLWQTDGERRHIVIHGHGRPLYSLALSPDGQTLAAGGDDGTVRIWRTTQQKEPITLRGHVGAVLGMDFAPDGQHLVTAGHDGTVRIWHLGANAEPVVFKGYRSPAATVTYSPNSNELLTTHRDGTVQIQRCDVCGSPGQTLALAKHRTTRQLTAEERATFAVP